jgi:hypothetical protein
MEVTACQNIGPKERRIRMNTFYLWGAVSLIGAGVLVAMRMPWTARVWLGLPAAISAFGLFQARANTCVAFAAANVKVLGDSRKETIKVTDEAERAAFRKVSRKISLQSISAAAAFTLLLVLLP